MSITSQCHIAQ